MKHALLVTLSVTCAFSVNAELKTLSDDELNVVEVQSTVYVDPTLVEAPSLNSPDNDQQLQRTDAQIQNLNYLKFNTANAAVQEGPTRVTQSIVNNRLRNTINSVGPIVGGR